MTRNFCIFLLHTTKNFQLRLHPSIYNPWVDIKLFPFSFSYIHRKNSLQYRQEEFEDNQRELVEQNSDYMG